MASCCGGNQQTGTSTTSLTPDIKQRYLDLLDRAKGVSDIPYQGYGGQRVAGMTPDQEASFAGIRGAQTSYQSDLDKARQQAGISAMPLAGSVGTFDKAALEQYGNPYESDVISAAQTELDRQRQLSMHDQDTRAGSGGGIGAYGPGVRAGLERTAIESDASRNAASTIAGLRSQNFAQAQQQFNTEQNRGLAARQNDAARAAAAAGQYVGIGGAGLNYGLTAAQAQYGAGSAQQQNQQQNLDTAYADFLRQQGYPAEQVNFLSGIYRGYPTTSTTTQSVPGANPYVQGLGLGIAGLGALGAAGGSGGIGSLFSARGGRVSRRRMAHGGRVYHRPGGYGGHGLESSGGGFQDGGSVKDDYGTNYSGMTTDELGALVDQGDMAAYDEYVGRLSSSTGPAAADLSMPDTRETGDRGIGDTGDYGAPAPNRFLTYGQQPDTRETGPVLGRTGSGGGIGDMTAAGQLNAMGPSGGPSWLQSFERAIGIGGSNANAGAAAPGYDVGSMDFGNDPTLPLREADPGYQPDAVSWPARPLMPPRGPRPAVGVGGARTAPGTGPTVAFNPREAGIGAAQPVPGFRQPSGGGISDDTAQALVKKASGTDPAKSEDAPSWAMPMIMAGLSMAASRNPSVMGAIGEAGMVGISSYIDQKRFDAQNALKSDQLSREIARDEDTRKYHEGDLLLKAGQLDTDTAYKQSMAASRAETAAAATARAKGGGGGSPTERIIAHIQETKDANGKPLFDYPTAVRLAHGAAINDQKAIDDLAIAYAKGKQGSFGAGGDSWVKDLEEGRKWAGSLGARASAAPTTTPPPGAVDYLKAHPEVKDQFDAKYGTGASASYLGQ